MLAATTHRWRVLLPLLLAFIAVVAAACSDNDFDGTVDDRGAAAARSVGAAPRESDTVAQSADQDADESAQALSGDAARGRELFFANGCNICHGDSGGGNIGPAIAKTTLTLDEVITQYRDPQALMPPFDAGRVPDDDVADIYAFLQSLE